MRKLLTLTLSLVCIFILSACGAGKPKEVSKENQLNAAQKFEAARMESSLRTPDYKKVEQFVAEAAKLNPANTDYWYNLGAVRNQLKDYAGAEKAFAEAAKLSPDNDVYWFDLAIARCRTNNKSGARDAYKKTVEACENMFKKEPANGNYLFKQIRPLILLGRTDDARSVVAKLLKQYPNDPNVQAQKDVVDLLLKDPQLKEFSVK